MVQRGMGCLGTIVFLTVFTLVGGSLSYFGWGFVQEAQASATWPSTPGEITWSQVSVDSDSDGTTYGADIGFEYVVRDRLYTGDRVTVLEVSSSSLSRAQNIVNQYPVGEQVTVYYNPDNPEASVLEAGTQPSSYFIFAIGLCFLCVPALAFPTILIRAVLGLA
ncbi:MAG TPA: DUF3592 domain-containing protein [Anaerolineae bacterium]|nr:DUF3592 domain-containing protein [Anaerolineae bacterium]